MVPSFKGFDVVFYFKGTNDQQTIPQSEFCGGFTSQARDVELDLGKSDDPSLVGKCNAMQCNVAVPFRVLRPSQSRQ